MKINRKNRYIKFNKYLVNFKIQKIKVKGFYATFMMIFKMKNTEIILIFMRKELKD
jgi:hypothetical protein